MREGCDGQPALGVVHRPRVVRPVRAVNLPAAAEVDGQLGAPLLVDDVGRVVTHDAGQVGAVGVLERIWTAALHGTEEGVRQVVPEADRIYPGGRVAQCAERQHDDEHKSTPLNRRLTGLPSRHGTTLTPLGTQLARQPSLACT